MGNFFDHLNPKLQQFIERQKIFFVATAPTQGRINLSPKGLDTLRCLDERTLAYLDLTGSGNETAAHLHENGRMTLMFCSFAEAALILRVYGQGRVVRPRDPEWKSLHSHFDDLPGQRQIIVCEIESVQTSCGGGVPTYAYQGNRQNLLDWARSKGPQGIEAYWHENNQQSIDGVSAHLPVD